MPDSYSGLNESELKMMERDKKVIWHPYSQHGLNPLILPVVSARGGYLRLADGREILDGISSWWVNIHGHAHPALVQAIEKQASKMEHVIFAGFTHEPAIELAELLTQYPAIQRAGLSRVFYSDNGSTAVEVALKMAYQYHLNLGNAPRNRFIAFHHSYHGDTLGAMSVGEPVGYHSQFRSLMPEVDFVEPGDFAGLCKIVERYPDSHAALIFEPLVQGAGGMRMYDPDDLEKMVQFCKAHSILTIADEVFTGFYRTGKCFAIEYLSIQPDFLCLSKGITGGFLPLAVTLTAERIYSAFLSQDIRAAFLHGHSYTANPIACAAGIASWNLLQSVDCKSRVEMISNRTQTHIQRLKNHPKVISARCLGTIGAVEIRNSFDYFSEKPGALLNAAIQKGVLLRPLGNVFYAVPPYCLESEEIDRIYNTMEELIGKIKN